MSRKGTVYKTGEGHQAKPSTLHQPCGSSLMGVARVGQGRATRKWHPDHFGHGQMRPGLEQQGLAPAHFPVLFSISHGALCTSLEHPPKYIHIYTHGVFCTPSGGSHSSLPLTSHVKSSRPTGLLHPAHARQLASETSCHKESRQHGDTGLRGHRLASSPHASELQETAEVSSRRLYRQPTLTCAIGEAVKSLHTQGSGTSPWRLPICATSLHFLLAESHATITLAQSH